MICEKARKLSELKVKAEKKFKAVSLPVAVGSLNTETPPGHIMDNKRLVEIREAREERDTAEEAYQNHLKSCPVCGCSKRDGDKDGVPCESICC